MTKILAASLLSSLVLAGCPAPGDQNNQGDLRQFRAALPTMDQLTAGAPQASVSALVGESAELPQSSYGLVEGINGAVAGIVLVLEEVTRTEPTLFNSETNEFLWGPFDNPDGVGTVAAFIRDTGGEGDFRFEYALLRGANNDVATMVPVILGGATPDEAVEGDGAGVTLWDFEADRAFEQANNPDFDNLVLDRGRFVAAYGAGPDEDNAGARVAVVVAAFRDFVSKDDPEAAPADLDFLYGRYAAAPLTVDFFDWRAGIDISDPADGIAEDVGVRMAFVNEGAGRAEADAVGGSLDADQRAEVVECWDDSISRTFLSLELLRDGQSEGEIRDGELSSCGLFAATLSELGVPALEDVSPELLTALDDAATNGIPLD